MRLVRRIGVCALAAGALALVAGAATASAADYPVTGLPEIGRCLSKPGSGGFKGLKAVCIVHSPTHTGNFEWYPGPGANASIKLKLSGPTFETVNGRKIGCAFLFADGELTGGKTLKISEVQIQGCAIFPENLACYSNPLEPNKIVSKTPLVGELEVGEALELKAKA